MPVTKLALVLFIVLCSEVAPNVHVHIHDSVVGGNIQVTVPGSAGDESISEVHIHDNNIGQNVQVNFDGSHSNTINGRRQGDGIPYPSSNRLNLNLLTSLGMSLADARLFSNGIGRPDLNLQTASTQSLINPDASQFSRGMGYQGLNFNRKSGLEGVSLADALLYSVGNILPKQG